jgi:homoserine/homoserine lactone efflux protein
MYVDLWLTFFAACWMISLTPGPGAVASMSSGLQHGFLRGYWNAIGLQIALILQITIVAIGIGKLLTTSPFAFHSIKWLGVIYLLFLAIKQWQHPSPLIQSPSSSPKLTHPFRLLSKGFLVNASNPKAIIFILAVLPQFINPHQPLFRQYAIMTITMISVDLFVMALYTGLASKVLLYLTTPRQQQMVHRSFSVMFTGAALLLSWVHHSN